jgi:putative nucleotidyltransferase with HDIG domain
MELEGERQLSIPLKTSKKIIGVLNISNPKSGKIFTESDLYLISILAGQAAISLENAQLFKNIEETYLSTMKTFSLMLEGKSPYTLGHSERVGEYAIAIAKKMQLNSEEIYTIKQGAILHDIGKIGISDAILNKKGKLTNDEYDTIKKHPEIGFEMLKPIKFVKKALLIIKHHHERMDGNGYPDGKTGGNLSSLERICMVADAFDAMRSTRPYRKSLSEKEILNELESNAGTQFDKEVITALIRTEKSLFQERQNIENAIST